MDNYLTPNNSSYLKHKKTVLITYLFFYYSIFIVFGLSDRLLSQALPSFFSFNRDLTELFIIATGLPKFMIHNKQAFIIADIILFSFPVIIIACYLLTRRFSIILGGLFIVFITIYIHLENILLSVTPTMYIGLVLLGFIFLTNKEAWFYNIVALCKYYFLYTMFTAAIWKIARGAVFNYEEMSNILIFQHGNVLAGNCNSWYCGFYYYLIDHSLISYLLYLLSVIIELLFVIGFFSKKYNRLLFIISVVFFVVNLVIMRIPFWPFLLLGSTLLIDDKGRTPGNIFSLKEWQTLN